MMRFQRAYFLISLSILGLEIFIACCMDDSIIRPYGGDFLAVILLYCLVRSFCAFSVRLTAGGVLLFSYAVEVSQYFHLADRLGFRKPSLMRILLGNYFTWVDMIVYTLGVMVVIMAEKWVGALRPALSANSEKN